MKRSNENRGPADMPSFLDESSDQAETGSALAAQTDDGDELPEDEPVDPEEALADDPEQAYADDAEDELEDEPALAPEPAEHVANRRPTARTGARAARQGSAGGAASALGVLLALAAGVATQVPAVVEALAQRHLDAQLLVLCGLLLWTIGRGQRNSAALHGRLAQLEQDRRDADEELHDTIRHLHERAAPQVSPHDGGELEHVMLSLQRQDQKINNLTKAIKMYGKPLMDIAGQGTDIAGAVAQVRTLVEAGAESTRSGLQRLEEQGRKASKQLDLGDLPTQVKQLGVSLAAVTQRLEDTEVRKSLVRLEDFAKELRQEVQVLQRGEPTQAAAEAMIARLEEARKGLAAGIQQLRDGNLNGLENSVRELLREVSGLATSTAQIQAAVKGGARIATGPASPTGTVAAPAAASPAPAATPAAAPVAATSPEGEGEGATGYQTGKRNTAGKNVLGAIARLKQMKG
ncbi:MAG: hypothetical protein H6835_02225 [Planctomycetes bacterium]|nr:hypothetical protein [Planctomycetota bacterium]